MCSGNQTLNYSFNRVRWQDSGTEIISPLIKDCYFCQRSFPIIHSVNDTVFSASVTLHLRFMSLVITAIQLRQQINNIATIQICCSATVVLQKEDHSPAPQTVKNRVWHKRNCMGSNQLDTQLEVTRGLEASARKMEMSVVNAPTKVIFFFPLGALNTDCAWPRRETKWVKEERGRETDVRLRKSLPDLSLFSFLAFISCLLFQNAFMRRWAGLMEVNAWSLRYSAWNGAGI